MTRASSPRFPRSLFLVIGPGLLVAATGVGAGDLATASFTGSQLGTAVLWAVVVGGFLKFLLNEGLTRWQLATGETLLEGIAHRLGRGVGWLFLPYLLLWSFFVGSALMSACGVTLHAMLPIFGDAADGKIAFGFLSSLAGLVVVWVGGFSLFEKVMSVCIAVMFGTVLVTGALLSPGAGEVLRGLVVPTIPAAGGEGITWTVALIGGVGGTLTVLCYGYWIREKGRLGPGELTTCRIDLGVAYAMTVVFGIAMVIIGTTVRIEGQGAGLLVSLADSLEGPLGLWGRWLFLIGAFGAVFSSLLGVWQSVPYLFGDIWRLFLRSPDPAGSHEPGVAIDTRSAPYRGYLVGIAIVPTLGLLMSFREVQKFYAVIGAMFIPMLALVLLILNGRREWVGDLVNRRPTVATLIAAIAFFGWMAWRQWS
ncbi:MAG TPA: Nramp family divalent metal transporter [Acidobacteriota bacterium]|nr:Nramp family divalent metal transporter [Acidobacteriota bacterium]